ncbi:MAG: hypothetical protein ILA24_02300 [Ruminococcus sp.]|nr:hypothetical protein [Ruminococcus sp.]
MAKKQETISEQVVRLYKEGYDLDRIASIMQMSKVGARGVLEKYMPDYENYHQPPAPTEDPSQEKGVIGRISNPFKGRKKKEETSAPSTVNLNLNYDENGFIDKHTESIAKMIRRGDSDKRIAEFFNCSVSDVKAVKQVLDQQTDLAKASPADTVSKQTPEEEEVFNPFMPEKKKHESEPVQSQPQQTGGYDPYAPNAPLDPYAVPYDPTNPYDPNAPLDPYAVPYDPTNPYDPNAPLDPYAVPYNPNEAEQEYVPNIKFDDDDGLEEMPSISTDNLVFAEPPVKPSTDAIDAIATDDISFDMDALDSKDENISFELKESDAEMTASEKMKMFAKQQIDENNTKLEALKKEKESTAKELASAEAELATTKASIDDCETQISQLNIQLSEINAKLTDLRSRLSEHQINETKLLDNTVKNRAAVQDIENAINEIMKDNSEYEAFLK